LFYEVVEDHVTRRAPFRDEHLRLLNEAHERRELVMAGALSEPVDGAVLIFCAADDTVPRRFAERDPYVRNGLVTRLNVRPSRSGQAVPEEGAPTTTFQPRTFHRITPSINSPRTSPSLSNRKFWAA